MRLLTHNFLACPRTKAHPLLLRAATCDDVDVPFQAEFVRRMIPRLDWGAFVDAASQLPDAEALAQLPDEAPRAEDAPEPLLRAVHRLLLEWHVVDGELAVATTCAGADGEENPGEHTYKIRDGVPNLILTEVRQEGDISQS